MRELLALTILTIAAQAADMSGHYVLRNVMEVGSELLLKPNGTFEFALAYGATDYDAKGTWRTGDGAVILNTDGKEEPPFRLTRSETTRSPGSRVWVRGPRGEPAPNIEVALKTAAGTSTAETNEHGAAEFPTVHAAQRAYLRLAVYEIEAGPFTLSSAHSDFYFEINGAAITRFPFRDERLKIDGTALIMTHYGTDHPMRYEKQ